MVWGWMRHVQNGRGEGQSGGKWDWLAECWVTGSAVQVRLKRREGVGYDPAGGAVGGGGGARFRPVGLAPLVVWRSIQAFGDVARPSGRAVQWRSWPGRLWRFAARSAGEQTGRVTAVLSESVERGLESGN